jgi:hypothetical protein
MEKFLIAGGGSPGRFRVSPEEPGLPPPAIKEEETDETMDRLTLFGLVAVSAMLAFYAIEQKSSWCVLGFAGACVMGSAYGFLQGAWPFGLVEAVWSIVALRRWLKARVRMER